MDLLEVKYAIDIDKNGNVNIQVDKETKFKTIAQSLKILKEALANMGLEYLIKHSKNPKTQKEANELLSTATMGDILESNKQKEG